MLGKAHVCSTQSQKIPQCCLWSSSNGGLTDRSFLVLSRQIIEPLPVSTLLSSCWSIVWYLWLFACRWCLKLLNTADLPSCRPLVMVALLASLICFVFLHSSFGETSCYWTHQIAGSLCKKLLQCYGIFVPWPVMGMQWVALAVLCKFKIVEL